MKMCYDWQYDRQTMIISAFMVGMPNNVSSACGDVNMP